MRAYWLFVLIWVSEVASIQINDLGNKYNLSSFCNKSDAKICIYDSDLVWCIQLYNLRLKVCVVCLKNF